MFISHNMVNIFLVSHILLLFQQNMRNSENRSAKHEKLGKYWSYCTRNHAITNAYFVLIVEKMNEIISKFLLAGDKFMPEMHLKQPGFTYSACGPFIKNNERIQKFKETGDANYIYKNELGKACFQHDIAYEDFKELARRIALDKTLRGKPFHIAKNSKNDGYQRELVSMDYNFFYKKSANSGVATFTNISAGHKQLAEDIHKPIIRNFEKKNNLFWI